MAEIKGTVLATGASRESGAEAAVGLAQLGYNVMIGFKDKDVKAQSVADRIAGLGLGVKAGIVGGSLDDYNALDDYVAHTARFAAEQGAPWVGIVHMAAAGLRDTDDVADAVNHLGPHELTRQFMAVHRGRLEDEDPPRGSIIYATSHPAHLWEHPDVPRLDGYDKVGRTKRAGETALRKLVVDGSDGKTTEGLHFGVVTGDLLGDTINAKLLARFAGVPYAEFVDGRNIELTEKLGRPGPGKVEFGLANASSFDNPLLPTGHTLYVPRPVNEGAIMTNDQLAKMGSPFSVVG